MEDRRANQNAGFKMLMSKETSIGQLGFKSEEEDSEQQNDKQSVRSKGEGMKKKRGEYFEWQNSEQFRAVQQSLRQERGKVCQSQMVTFRKQDKQKKEECA